MKRRRHTPEQVIRKLREADRLLAEGKDVEEVARHLEVSTQTYHRWRNQFGGMKADDAKKLKELERENGRLKRLLAEAELDKATQGDRRGKMVTPNQRRRVAGMLMERFGVSQRHACRLIGQARSTQRLAPPVPDDEEQRLRAWLRDFATRRPRWGWRRAADGLRRDGWTVNNKRVRRLWRDEGLRVVHRKRKKPLRGDGHVGTFCPIRPNVLWALDFQFDQTGDARTIKLLNVIDEHTRECPAIVVDRNIDADEVVATLDRIAAERGTPMYLRFDNGPEFIAAAVADWCRFNTTTTVFIEPGSPWRTPGSRASTAAYATNCSTASSSTASSRHKSSSKTGASTTNMHRPHSALGMLTPTEYATRRHQEPQLQLS